MADRAILPVALDSNGDIVSGAKAYFLERGTVTPMTVYEDETATTPHATPVLADAAGVFPPVFVLTGFKVDIRDDLGASLPGYPSDPGFISTATAPGAAGVTFAPITGNSATNVQAAIANLTTLWNAVTAFGKSLVAAADAAAARTVLGLGGLATLDVLDEDDMASDSATRPPSQQSTKAYADAVEVAAKAAAIGVGQTWQDVSGSRAIDTSYQNTTGQPIMVNIQGSTALNVSTDNTTWLEIGSSDRSPAIIPNNHYYKGVGGGISKWVELRA